MCILPFDTERARSPFGWDRFLIKACIFSYLVQLCFILMKGFTLMFWEPEFL